MLIAGPIVRVRKPLGRPIETPLKVEFQLLYKSLIASEQADQPGYIMRHFKSIVPRITFNIVI